MVPTVRGLALGVVGATFRPGRRLRRGRSMAGVRGVSRNAWLHICGWDAAREGPGGI